MCYMVEFSLSNNLIVKFLLNKESYGNREAHSYTNNICLNVVSVPIFCQNCNFGHSISNCAILIPYFNNP